MNRKGQTLVAFVIIVPVFILLLAFVVDTGYLLKEATKLNSVSKTILRTTYQERMETAYSERVITLFEKNDIPVDSLELKVSNDAVQLNNAYSVESIFGKIIGLKEYRVKVTLKAQEINGDIVIEKE